MRQEATKEQVRQAIKVTKEDDQSLQRHIIEAMLELARNRLKSSDVLAEMMYLYPLTLNDMFNRDDYQGYISDKTGNDLFINDPERAERIHEAAKYGGDGSTHAEHIQDWRDFINDSDFPDWCKDHLLGEADEVEEWHGQNGRLDEVTG